MYRSQHSILNKKFLTVGIKTTPQTFCYNKYSLLVEQMMEASDYKSRTANKKRNKF